MKSHFLLFVSCLLALADGAVAAEQAIAPKMVHIPAGKIATTACPAGITVCPYEEYTEQVVAVQPFELAETEVTFAQWDACVADGGCASPASEWAYENRPVKPPCVEDAVCQYPDDAGWGRGKRPVINVSWDDVQLYLKWLNARTGGHYRLPSSAEWEHAALGGMTSTYPWGEKLGRKNANCDGCGSQWDGRQTAPVASFKPNRFGAYDMAGNVAEWVSTCFPNRKKGSRECNTYIYRGGAWSMVSKAMDPRLYSDMGGNLRTSYVGFRLAR